MIHYIITNHNHNKEAAELAEYITNNVNTSYASAVTIYDNGSECLPVFTNVIGSGTYQSGLWSYFNIRNLIDCPYVVFLDSSVKVSTDIFHNIETLSLRASQGSFIGFDPVALNFQGTVIYETAAFVKYTANLYKYIEEFENQILKPVYEGLDGYILELMRYMSILDGRGFINELTPEIYSNSPYLKPWREVITSSRPF